MYNFSLDKHRFDIQRGWKPPAKISSLHCIIMVSLWVSWYYVTNTVSLRDYKDRFQHHSKAFFSPSAFPPHEFKPSRTELGRKWTWTSVPGGLRVWAFSGHHSRLPGLWNMQRAAENALLLVRGQRSKWVDLAGEKVKGSSNSNNQWLQPQCCKF